MTVMRQRPVSVFWNIPIVLIALIVIVPVKAQMTSQHFTLPVSTLDSGGGKQESSAFGMQNAIGQPMAPGTARSANFALFYGLHARTVEELFVMKGQRGDVDNNGNINVLDIIVVANVILGYVSLMGDAVERADCDGNGTINIVDALGIANVILGIFPGCPGGIEKVEEPKSRKIEK